MPHSSEHYSDVNPIHFKVRPYHNRTSSEDVGRVEEKCAPALNENRESFVSACAGNRRTSLIPPECELDILMFMLREMYDSLRR